MSRRHDEERTRQIRQSRTRRSDRSDARDGRGYDYGPYYDRNGDEFYEDYDGNRQYIGHRDARYERDRDRDRQETKRTGLKVLGVVCVALIALFGVMVFSAQEPSQTGQVPQGSGEAPQQQAPQEAPQQAPETPQQVPAAPEVQEVPENPATQEQVEGLRADVDRQLVEIRQSINELRLQIMSWLGGQQEQSSG